MYKNINNQISSVKKIYKSVLLLLVTSVMVGCFQIKKESVNSCTSVPKFPITKMAEGGVTSFSEELLSNWVPKSQNQDIVRIEGNKLSSISTGKTTIQWKNKEDPKCISFSNFEVTPFTINIQKR